jgi:hypothetical protein
MNARRALVLLAVLTLALAPLAAALPSGRTAEALALPSGRTAEAAAGAPQARPETKTEVKAEAAPAAQAQAPPQQPAAKKAPALPSGRTDKASAKRTEPILPAYQTPKEKTAVLVFFVWLWLSIGVLVYYLRWWVQEADRVFRARFYDPVESPRKDDPLPPLLGE